jgi:hypothetical protein
VSARQRAKINERFAPERSDAVHSVAVDGEAVLLDQRTGRLHLLNATGALLWACFDGQSSIGEIVTDISEELGLQREIVLAETLALSRNLASEGLLANAGSKPRIEEPSSTDESTDGRPFLPEPPNP